MRSTTILRVAGLATLLAVLGGLTASPASAIPAFARKYETSCQTCHIAYPKLNAFGESFRLLGYRMPGETEDQVKQEPVRLGSDAYKRVWPDAVWPATIPSHVPLAVSSEFLVEESDAVDSDFRFPSSVELVAAGTAGDNVSYFGEIAFRREPEHGELQNETEVEHIDLRFIRPFAQSLAFNVKVGAFQPELVQTFDHARRLTVANYDSMFGVNTLERGGASSVGGGGHHGGTGISLPAVATGFEGYGVVAHRFLWNLGLVNGLGPGEGAFDGNDAKDVYGRVATKWGGIAFDGSNADEVQQAKAWRERSFEIGLFGYQGDGDDVRAGLVEEEPEDEHSALSAPMSRSAPSVTAVWLPHSEPAFIEDEEFTRYGVDFNAFWDDFNLFGAYVEGEDDIRTILQTSHGDELIDGDLDTFEYEAFFVELDAVLGYPWLHGAVRYENVDLPAGGAGVDEHGDEGEDEHGEEDGHITVDNTFERGVVSVTALVRANVKTTLEYAWNLDDSSDDVLWLNFGIAF